MQNRRMRLIFPPRKARVAKLYLFEASNGRGSERMRAFELAMLVVRYSQATQLFSSPLPSPPSITSFFMFPRQIAFKGEK